MLPPADRLDIIDLVHRYAARVDMRDLPGAAALFTADGVLAVPRKPGASSRIDVFEGRAAIERALARVLRLDGTVHEIVGHVIDADPASEDRARGRTACVAHHFSRGKDDQWYIHYDDNYVRTAVGWRLARRALTIDAMRLSDVRHPSGAGPARLMSRRKDEPR
ncbi:nuclear transport factor 2 family protein [Microbacterium sp. NIBRBAC000506063]|uniref:nuclear transport factor 2 family protein n=1 Tax=Microbacterium sp. NIBRBAC000506063 TaxID=2734618 RepID=UPI001BB4FFBE|nr:nuclear transport factor 2 family protein [Microbacterium sp. NIBRBAC000506063]QTV79093.1 nuclear transport factor 2 family protein [Microbacterium sp. NIBRBAC000506063]